MNTLVDLKTKQLATMQITCDQCRGTGDTVNLVPATWFTAAYTYKTNCDKCNGWGLLWVYDVSASPMESRPCKP